VCPYKSTGFIQTKHGNSGLYLDTAREFINTGIYDSYIQPYESQRKPRVNHIIRRDNP
jgi:hypothetical protein